MSHKPDPTNPTAQLKGGTSLTVIHAESSISCVTTSLPDFLTKAGEEKPGDEANKGLHILGDYDSVKCASVQCDLQESSLDEKNALTSFCQVFQAERNFSQHACRQNFAEVR